MSFSLRPWIMDDLESLIKFANNKNIASYMTKKIPHPYTKETGVQFIKFASKQNHKIFLLLP
jgi:hypothetical protein